MKDLMSLGGGLESSIRIRQSSTVSEEEEVPSSWKDQGKVLEEGNTDLGLKTWHAFGHQSVIDHFCLLVKKPWQCVLH